MQEQAEARWGGRGLEDWRRKAKEGQAVRRGGMAAEEEEFEEVGEGASEEMQPQAAFGWCLMRAIDAGGRRRDYARAEIRRIQSSACGEQEAAEEEEVAIFGVFDEHGAGGVGRHLSSTLFDAILNGGGLRSDAAGTTRDAYLLTDRHLCAAPSAASAGGSTAVTAMLHHHGARLVVANLGDSRAVLCKDGVALQLSVDHTPARPLERASVEMRGGVVITIPGDIPRVDGLLGVARTFGDASLKEHMSAKPDVCDLVVDISFEFLILGSNGLWAAFPTNQEAVDMARNVADPLAAAKLLAREARARGSGDEISCVVIRFIEL